MSRATDADRFYTLLRRLNGIQGVRYLRDCTGTMAWPARGVYFFFDPAEPREANAEPRVVRVGTHALSAGSKTRLWQRLAQHRGNVSGPHQLGGSHRGSIFRLHVGAALIRRSNGAELYPSWGVGNSASREIRAAEYPLECQVSRYIRELPFAWVEVDDPPGPESLRGKLERNAVALLTNRNRPAIDAASADWLGHASINSAIRESGLWNVNYVDADYDPSFLDDFEKVIDRIEPQRG